LPLNPDLVAFLPIPPRRCCYVPCEIIRDLRELTTVRTSLSPESFAICGRIQKGLEDANFKLVRVATNTVGKSGRAILEESRRLLDQVQFVGHEMRLPEERLEDIGRQTPELSEAVGSLGHDFGVEWQAGLF
jgi:hypothetical protein